MDASREVASREPTWEYMRRLAILLVTVSVFATTGCQTFPAGERLEEVTHEPDYSLEELRAFFDMARAAWREREEYRETGWDLHYFGDEDTHILGVAIPRGETLYLAFRGSQAHRHLRDLRMNAMVWKRRVPYAENPRIRAYWGFLVKYLAIRDEVHRLIERFEPDRILLIGHSGGGAVVSLAFLDLYPGFPEKEVRAITFGMPRIFNRRGAIWFDEQEEQLLRIVNGRDLITGLPPAILGYRHVGRLVRMGERSRWLPFSLKDHWPGYHEGLEAMIQEQGDPPRED